ncbi:hypothetical protein Afil01_30020 [Actinorhabdospora filicis]|uniref:Uncharacterized protein n=1 Tax=Actinorhabdospora filicis TaxID=1785913 RepID=A0A9W6SLN4_9ACTN|nr:hypothetical protein [Actinorhabdospora filicis]GLZ78195.1 hypothetical protein Afil01_30020 [Actinorhabdospora filicis]
MTTRTAWWGLDDLELAGPEAVGDLFEEITTRWYTSGVRGVRVLCGPSEAGVDGAELQVDIDAEEGRAHVVWLPSGEVGCEPGAASHHRDLTVHVQPGEPNTVVPGRLCRVTPKFAAEAVEEYAMTGTRAVCLAWFVAGISGSEAEFRPAERLERALAFHLANRAATKVGSVRLVEEIPAAPLVDPTLVKQVAAATAAAGGDGPTFEEALRFASATVRTRADAPVGNEWVPEFSWHGGMEIQVVWRRDQSDALPEPDAALAE